MGRPEDSRVKIPALVHFTRLGYTYMSIKDKTRGLDYDPDTNIFYALFTDAINRINGTDITIDDAKKIIEEIKIKLDNDDLGKSFYQLLKDGINGLQLIDFNRSAQNDKVINIRNMEGTAYPKNEGARNYIANGEIGICCGDYKFKPCRKHDDNSLRVEFSSQKGYGYYYNFANFNEETGTNDLELAYALTVHKSQGSQFDTVILILAEPCRILSREMLYTALTRQKKKIVVLYNDDPHLLMKYVSPENSDIAQRFTDLFAEMRRTDDSENKPSIIKVGNKFYEDSLIHRTTRGELVRSKSEVVIADHLLSNKVNYDYEPEITIGDKKFRPDFVAYDPDDDDIFWYWEHVGMPTDPGYMARWEKKKAYYAEHGIIEGKNLIITCDGDDGSLDAQEIDKLIKKIFDLD